MDPRHSHRCSLSASLRPWPPAASTAAGDGADGEPDWRGPPVSSREPGGCCYRYSMWRAGRQAGRLRLLPAMATGITGLGASGFVAACRPYPVFSISRANSFRGFRSKMCMHACLLINPDCALCRLVPLTPLAMVEPISPHASRRSCAHPPGETHILPFEQG